MKPRAAEIAAAFEAACLDELDAPKPGNVHAFADGHRMTAAQFETSAAAAAAPIAQAGTRVGARIEAAVMATFAAVGVNTNLGIILLCAPLAAAAERGASSLRAAVAAVLDDLDLEDARHAFSAIVRAAPAGLGRAEQHDVFAPPTVTLREAMAAAADRDRIARQYASGFADIFEVGETNLVRALAAQSHPRWATLAVYIGFLAAFPDTHIVRKHGSATARAVQHAAAMFHQRLQSHASAENLLSELLTWDAELKRKDINPGTSADLTVATLFAYRLSTILPPSSNGG
ncbi:MAG: triphosphoribosyl-dephospho-CoA synthase [Xanthobacteraceae bacterium]|nr:triphosphoribosyl-dephospho-CoA synthase [Xanthobacteraceae bacterium]